MLKKVAPSRGVRRQKRKKKMEKYIAHINETSGLGQTCEDHCRKTAEYAKADLEQVGLGNIAYLAGLIHDMGKFTDEWNDYISKSSNDELVPKGTVIHTFAGVRMMLMNYHPKFTKKDKHGVEKITAEIIATAVGSHHGLFDGYDCNQKSGFCHRINKQPEYDERAMNAFFRQCSTKEDVDKLFKKSCAEIENILKRINGMNPKNSSEVNFYIGMLQRLINAAVMDGDRRDTTEFMGDYQFKDKIINGTQEMWNELSQKVVKNLNSFPKDTEIQLARRKMSDYCADFAVKKADGNIYKLGIPTGGGKTLTGLRYALEHAKKYGKKRIIFVVPLLSILDQNAKVIRENIGNDKLILEHHSNVVLEGKTKEEITRQELLASTWDAPIIITTQVQFLNTLFSGKTSAVRRLEALTDSVIVFDEVQTVPQKMISLLNHGLNFLSKICNDTILLCSATQPAFDKNNEEMILSKEEMIPKKEMEKIIRLFKRVNVIDGGIMTIDGIGQLAIDNCDSCNSVLIICNTKSEARNILSVIRDFGLKTIHLSTSMCIAHRQEKIRKMREMLDTGEKFVCVSTQLIEAGVDVSFGCVIRISAGIDSIVQSAGRCNRNGERNNPAPVYVVRLMDEHLEFLKEIEEGKDLTQRLFYEFTKNPGKFESDLISNKSIEYYYDNYFNNINNNKNRTKYTLKSGETIYNLISNNSNYARNNRDFIINQAFRTAGENFKVFDDEQKSVIIPYNDEAKQLITELSSNRALNDIYYCKKIIRELNQYTVQLFEHEYENYATANALYLTCENSIAVLLSDYYDDDIGCIPAKDMREIQMKKAILFA